MMSITPAATPALKRSRSDLEATSTPSPQAAQPTAKRPRVQFKSENTIHTLRGWDEAKTSSLIKEEVKRALEKKAEGNDTAFASLCELLVQKPTAADALSSPVLKRYLLALTSLSRTVGRTGLPLVQSILRISWLGRDDDFVRVYQALLANLLSTYGGFSHEILGSLVALFTTLRPHHGRLPHEPRVPVSKMHDRLHGCIQHLVQRVPSSVSHLSEELRIDFPHPADSLNDHLDYATNLMRVTSYIPQIKSEMIGIIFDKITKLDALLQTDVDQFDVELYNATGQDLAEQVSLILAQRNVSDEDQAEDDTSDSEDESVIDEFEDDQQRQIHQTKQEIAKLDALMIMMFNHFQSYFDHTKASSEERIKSMEALFDMFNHMVLTSENSRSVQFLLFHFAQTAPETSEKFVELLTGILLDFRADTMTRRSASAYLASFIARGSFVSRDLVRSTFETVANEMERLRGIHEQNDMIYPDLSRFSAYYTTFQCLMYIFCFRWRDLVEEQVDDDNFDVHDLKWSREITEPFRRNVSSRLNPLKVCAPSIVQQFRDVTRQLELLYLDGIIEQNKRIRLTRSMAMASGGFSIIAESNNQAAIQGEAHLQLNAYFPFDPYKLPLSKSMIENQYNSYKGVPGFDEDDEEVEEE